MIWKQRKKANLFCCYKNIQQQPEHKNIYPTVLKVYNFIKMRLQHRHFSVKFLKFLKECSAKHWVFSEKTHVGKISNFWNEITE